MTHRHRSFLALALASVQAAPLACGAPADARRAEFAFVYVHGFREHEDVPPFEEKLRAFLQPLPLNCKITTYRWDRREIDFTCEIQQNASTSHYRAVAIGKQGARFRKAWGSNLHSVLTKLGLFPGPYARVLK